MNLTKRETEVVALLAAGKTCDEIAGVFSRSVLTVRTQVKTACQRVEARNATHLVAKAISGGWIKVICLTLALTTVMDTGTDKLRVTARVRVMRPNYSRLEA